MKTILFQGDSITDAGRNREDDNDYGGGYPLYVTAEMSCEYPNEFKLINRGISGNRSADMYARIKSDVINLKPDYMSVLIGVNDVWHEFNFSNGIDAEKYYKIYSMFIEEIKQALPDIKIMILEPFTLKGTGNEAYWEDFKAEVVKRAEKSKLIAEKYNLPFVPLQEKFDEFSKNTETSYWLRDGVHPTRAGHMLITKEWIKAFNKYFK